MVSVTNESPVARLSWLRIQQTAKSKSARLEILQKLSRLFLLFLSFSYTSYVREKRWTFFVVSLAVRNWPLKNHLFPFPWNCTVLCIFKLMILSRCTTVLASIWFKSHHLKNTLKHFCSCFFLLIKKMNNPNSPVNMKRVMLIAIKWETRYAFIFTITSITKKGRRSLSAL